jgi:putative IMPACT (imprinted ancient) family translation regulator
MTNREAILRLSVNTGDAPAMTWLHDNNAKAIRAVVTRYFGVGPVADKAEGALMQRMADHARSYEQQEDPEKWLAKCINTECDRLRNEGIHDKANID